VSTSTKNGSTVSGAETIVAGETASIPVSAPNVISIEGMALKEFDILIKGTSPLIIHAWSHKAKDQMLSKQKGEGRQKKAPKDPLQDCLESLYFVKGDVESAREAFGDDLNKERFIMTKDYPQFAYGFPIVGFKAAAASAFSFVEGITKKTIRGALHLTNAIQTEQGELALIRAESLHMREDMVRIAMGTADIRFRGELRNWSTVLRVKFNSRVLTESAIVNLFNTAGFSIGVGEWRPERDGSFGMFEVDGAI